MTRRRLLLLFSMMAVPALSGRAPGHGLLERSDPRAEGVVRTPPTRIRLWFAGAIEPAYSRIEVFDERAQRVDVGEPTVDVRTRRSLTVAVPPLPPGRYRVKWRVLSVDAHVTEGVFGFSVAP